MTRARSRHPTLFDAACIAGLLVVAFALATLGLLGGWAS